MSGVPPEPTPIAASTEHPDELDRDVGRVQEAVDLDLPALVLHPPDAPARLDRLAVLAAVAVGALDQDVRVARRERLQLDDAAVGRDGLRDRTAGVAVRPDERERVPDQPLDDRQAQL